jgi:hypothetical protein
MAVVVFRAQRHAALAGRASFHASWAALAGCAVALLLLVVIFMRRYSNADSPLNYTFNNISSGLSTILGAALQAMLAAMLLPVLQQRRSRAIGALVVAAVLFAPALAQHAVMLLSSYATLAWPGALLIPVHPVAFALVACALFEARHRSFWDTLALQWGFACLLIWLRILLPNPITAPLWLADGQQLLLWALPALVALYCLLMWDRGSSPERPFLTLGRRIRETAARWPPD